MGKKSVYQGSFQSDRLRFKEEEEKSHRRAQAFADSLWKKAVLHNYEGQFKFGAGPAKPFLYTINNEFDYTAFKERVERGRSESIGRLRATIIETYEAVDRPDKDLKSIVYSEEVLLTSAAHKRAYSEVKDPFKVKKPRKTATLR